MQNQTDRSGQDSPTKELTLPCGKLVRIWLHHNRKKEVIQRWEKGKKKMCMVDSTYVKLEMDGKQYESIAICSPLDNKSLAFGRKLVTEKLLRLLRDQERFPQMELTKKDRNAIFLAICPEFTPKNLTKDHRRKVHNMIRQLHRHPEKMDQIITSAAFKGDSST